MKLMATTTLKKSLLARSLTHRLLLLAEQMLNLFATFQGLPMHQLAWLLDHYA